MSDIHRIGDLEIDQDLAQQRVGWRIQRVGWVLMGLAVVGSGLGLLGGSGLLSSRTAGDPKSPLYIEYEALLRARAPAEFCITLRPAGGEAAFTVDAAFLEDLDIKTVVPQPDRVESIGRTQRYVFATAAVSEPIRVVIHAEPAHCGTRRGVITVGNERVELSQFVYP